MRKNRSITPVRRYGGQLRVLSRIFPLIDNLESFPSLVGGYYAHLRQGQQTDQCQLTQIANRRYRPLCAGPNYVQVS